MLKKDFFDGQQLTISLVTKDSEVSIALENINATKYSTETVKTDEILYREICSPHHYDEDTGEILSSAFKDAFIRGLSVNRISLITKKEIKRMAEKKVEKKNKQNEGKEKEVIKFQGCSYVNAGDIRKIINSKTSNRHYVIYDTATRINKSHADVFNIIPDLNPGEIKKAQRELKKYFSKLIKSDSCE